VDYFSTLRKKGGRGGTRRGTTSKEKKEKGSLNTERRGGETTTITIQTGKRNERVAREKCLAVLGRRETVFNYGKKKGKEKFLRSLHGKRVPRFS